MKKKLYISNLGWQKKDNLKIFKILKKHKINGIDLAPIKLSKTWSLAEKKAYNFRKALRRFDLKINAIQGIFFNTKFNLFNMNKIDEKKLIKHLKRIIKISKIYNCNKIVLGSATFRNNIIFDKNYANKIFLKFFKKIDPLFRKKRITLCFETIPKQYGENYLYDIEHLVELIKNLDSPFMKINFDTSIFHYNKFDKKKFLKNKRLIQNIQISEKKFNFFDKPNKKNKLFCKLIKKYSQHKDISLEIISNKTNFHKIENSIQQLNFLLN